MKIGITSNILKIFAIIIVVIDHIGAYMYQNIDEQTYYILRSIGRMAMPIFSYLLVQGFLYTKNLKKYIFRIFVLATFTQLSLLILGFINQTYYPNYTRSVNDYLGVLYSYLFSLILLTAIDKKIIIKKLNENKNLILRINIILLIAIAYLNLNIEFDMMVPFITLELYAIEKLFEKGNKLLLKQENDLTIKKKIIYVALILLCFTISLMFVTYDFCFKYALLGSVLFIALYNGNKGKDSKLIQYLFYLIFPLQHIVLYILAMI